MILIDTSIWIDYVREFSNSKANVSREQLFKRSVAVFSPIIQEVLQLVSDSQRFTSLKTILFGFPKLETSANDISLLPANIYFQLRKKTLRLDSQSGAPQLITLWSKSSPLCTTIVNLTLLLLLSH